MQKMTGMDYRPLFVRVGTRIAGCILHYDCDDCVNMVTWCLTAIFVSKAQTITTFIRESSYKQMFKMAYVALSIGSIHAISRM